MLTALDLGISHSEQHIGFLTRWFREDGPALEKLQTNALSPYTASVQETFSRIEMTVENNQIIVLYDVSGINMPAMSSWSYSAEDRFETEGGKIFLREHKITKEDTKIFDEPKI